MAKQEQKKTARKGDPTEEVKANPAVTEKGKEIKGKMDELLDNIDDVLEENAEQFVKDYVQKGGQ